MGRLRWPLALVLSCSVYLIPFVGPHMLQLLGQWLVRALARAERGWAWTASELASVVVLQALALATWYWILGRPGSVRPLVLVPLVPIAIGVMNWLFLSALPARFLIERDEAPERATWPVACTVPDQSLARPGRRPAVVPDRGEPTFVQSATGAFARLAVTETPDGRVTCEVVALGGGTATANVAPIWAGEAGQVLLQRIDPQTGALSWQWLAERGVGPVALTPPEGPARARGSPVVARDGSVVAWLVPAPASGPPPTDRIVVRPVPPAPARDVVIPLDRLERASFTLLEIDPEAGEALLAINERSFAAVGFDGAIRWGPLRPEGVEALSMTFRRAGGGWVAWDGYREQDGYVVAWALPAGTGRHRVPKGRGVTDVAVHPSGGLVALSTTTTLSIGSVLDAVVVLGTADGRDVFRRRLPRYARSTVAFPTRTLFAYTEWDGARAEVRVLRVPPELTR